LYVTIATEFYVINMKRLLLLGNSKNGNEPYLAHAEIVLRSFLGDETTRVLFIPYARVLPSFETFASIARNNFERMGYQLASLHTVADSQKAIREAEAIVVGGGNTFYLLHNLYDRSLLQAIRDKVSSGTPYVGWSAGANIACPTIMTTNDMPIVKPKSFDALGLVPFQINPHYIDSGPGEQVTETREERLTEFVEVNPDVYVVGLRQGSMLRVEGQGVELIGPLGARIFAKGKEPKDVASGESVQFLLQQHTELCSVT